MRLAAILWIAAYTAGCGMVDRSINDSSEIEGCYFGGPINGSISENGKLLHEPAFVLSNGQVLNSGGEPLSVEYETTFDGPMANFIDFQPQLEIRYRQGQTYARRGTVRASRARFSKRTVFVEDFVNLLIGEDMVAEGWQEMRPNPVLNRIYFWRTFAWDSVEGGCLVDR